MLIVGTRADAETVHYPDIDLHYVRDSEGRVYSQKDGTPYPEEETDAED